MSDTQYVESSEPAKRGRGRPRKVQPPAQTHGGYIRIKEAITLAGLSRMTLIRWEKAGTLPKLHKLGGSAAKGPVGFVRDEFMQWLASRHARADVIRAAQGR